MTAAEVRAELERIWRDRPLGFPRHKAGWMLLAQAIEDNFGYWKNTNDPHAIVKVRGQRCPLPKRKSKYAGHGRAYLTPFGYERARLQRANAVRPEVVRSWSYCSD